MYAFSSSSGAHYWRGGKFSCGSGLWWPEQEAVEPGRASSLHNCSARRPSCSKIYTSMTSCSQWWTSLSSAAGNSVVLIIYPKNICIDCLRVIIFLLFLTGVSTSATEGGLHLLWQGKDFQIPDSKGRKTLSSIHHSHHRLVLPPLDTRKVVFFCLNFDIKLVSLHQNWYGHFLVLLLQGKLI